MNTWKVSVPCLEEIYPLLNSSVREAIVNNNFVFARIGLLKFEKLRNRFTQAVSMGKKTYLIAQIRNIFGMSRVSHRIILSNIWELIPKIPEFPNIRLCRSVYPRSLYLTANSIPSMPQLMTDALSIKNVTELEVFATKVTSTNFQLMYH